MGAQKTFNAAITASNLSGTNTGDQTSVSGNAGTATALQTARNINGTSFNGTANITVTADASTLTNTTLNSTVVTSSLTSVGTLGSLNVTAQTQSNGVQVGSASNTITVSSGTLTLKSASTAGVALQGCGTNTAVVAGNVGEVIDSLVTSSTNVGTTANYFDATSISVTAGIWEISGVLTYTQNSATMSGYNAIGISSTSGNSATGLTQGTTFFVTPTSPGSTPSTIYCPPIRVLLSATTTYYLKSYITYSAGTPQFTGKIHAVRVA